MYYGITISPILETMSLSRKMMEIWAASYIFSYAMKNLSKKLYKKAVNFLVPYIENDEVFIEKDSGIGRFPDRIIFETQTDLDDYIDRCISDVKEELSGIVSDTIGENIDNVKTFIDSYIRISYIKTDKCDNPAEEISEYLNNLDYFNPPIKYNDYLQQFLVRERLFASKLKKIAGLKGFESVAEIASRASGIKIEDKGHADSEDDYYAKLKSKLKETDKEFLKAYKYIATVHADGDNSGEAVKKNSSKVSKSLFEFGKKAEEILNKWGCNTVFLGGDDMLFFSPILFEKENTVLDLIEELRKAYKEKLESAYGNKKPSISFGISITYHKYPLSEALKSSRSALSGKAKLIKNAICATIRKHSGQSFEFTESFDSKTYSKFRELLRSAIGKKCIEFPKSLHHKLSDLSSVIKCSDNLDAIFENFFNEDEHKAKFKEGLQSVKELLEIYKNEQKKNGKSFEELFGNFFSMISMIKLLEGRENE